MFLDPWVKFESDELGAEISFNLVEKRSRLRISALVGKRWGAADHHASAFG